VPDLAVVTYLWSPDPGSKYSAYGPGDVRLLQRMVARHLSVPHDFVVVTDRPEAFAGDSAIRAVPIDWTTHVPGTCYLRLMTFSPPAGRVLGRRILQLDLDTVIVGDLGPVIDRAEDLVLWRNPRKWALTFPEVGYAKALAWFNASVILLRAGTWGVIWQNFDPRNPGARDDQWLISDYAGKDCPHWDESHGVYRMGSPSRPHLGVWGALPENARIVTFPGDSAKARLHGGCAVNTWIAEHRL